MVNTVTGALSNFIRSQAAQTSQAVGIAALKNNQQATQAMINQLDQNLQQTKATNAQSLAASGATLPRGSLVNITV